MNKKTFKPVAFYGHHKCATTWLRGILGEVGQLTNRSMSTFDNARQFDHDLAAHLINHPLGIVAYTNADIDQVRHLPPMPGVHLIRDPRDVVVSGYFSHKKSHPTDGWPELIEHRQRLNSIDQEEGLLAEIEFSGPTIDLMGAWDYAQASVLELRYEEVIRDPYAWLLKAGLHWGIVSECDLSAGDDLRSLINRVFASIRKVSRNRLKWQWTVPAVPAGTFLDIAYRHRFERITKGRKRGQEDTGSHYRKGVAGDWKAHFSERVAARFEERFPGMIEKLGYVPTAL